MSEETYLIWSNEHRAWWAPGRNGYVNRIDDAGSYSHAAALRICAEAMPGRFGYDPLNEIPVRLADLQAMLEQYRARYPDHDPEPPRE